MTSSGKPGKQAKQSSGGGIANCMKGTHGITQCNAMRQQCDSTGWDRQGLDCTVGRWNEIGNLVEGCVDGF